MNPEKRVDESWKESIAKEKTPREGSSDHPRIIGAEKYQEPEKVHATPAPDQADAGEMEISFFNYITSLAFQAMIFLGEVPNPMADNKIEPSLPQAKLLIDTLAMLRDKTKGNLTKEEDELLNSAVYELQVRFVELASKDKGQK